MKDYIVEIRITTGAKVSLETLPEIIKRKVHNTANFEVVGVRLAGDSDEQLKAESIAQLQEDLKNFEGPVG